VVLAATATFKPVTVTLSMSTKLVGGNELVGDVLAAGGAGTQNVPAVFLRGNRPIHRAQYVAREFPGAEHEAGDPNVVGAGGEGVADDVAKVNGPSIGCAVDGAVAVVGESRNSSQCQAENCERSNTHFQGTEPSLGSIQSVQTSIDGDAGIRIEPFPPLSADKSARPAPYPPRFVGIPR